MDSARTTFCAWLAALCVLLAGDVHAADLLRDVDEAYARRGVERPVLDTRSLDPAEGRFLEELFSLTDEAVLLNTEAMRWFVSGGERGLHPAVHLERIDGVRERLGALETPERVASVKALLVECLGLQRGFVADWSEALAEGRPFESQLTHEYAYHEGLHRSQRQLLKAYAELRALFPDAGAAAHAAFRTHLRAVNIP
ncbi:MAG: hypothetical protein ABFS41_11275 [Myxococcota bacterium]